MGCYDFFVGKCPKCGEKLYIQTKLFNCEFHEIKAGECIIVGDSKIALKEDCHKCGCKISAVIEKGVYVGLTEQDGKEDEREGYFGEFLESGQTKEEQYNKIMKDVDEIAGKENK